MRKLILTGHILAIVLLTACFDSAGGNNKNNEYYDEGEQEQLARVVIPLPVNTPVKAIGLPAVKDKTNFFQVIFYKKDIDAHFDAYFSETADISEGSIEVQIPAGIYDILLLAGYMETPNNIPLLLASSYKLDAGIVLEEKNVINMELALFDLTIYCDENIILGEIFNPYFEIDTKNPLIHLSPDRLSGAGLRLVSDNLNISMNCGDDNVTNNSDYNYNLINNGDKYRFEFKKPIISVFAESAILSVALDVYIHDFYWVLADPYYSGSGLQQYYQKTINFIERQAFPDVEISITWPEE